VISANLADQTSGIGDTVTFHVGVTGTSPMSFQWVVNGGRALDGLNVSGSSTDTLTLRNIQGFNYGDVVVTISNAYGSVSSTAKLQLPRLGIKSFAGLVLEAPLGSKVQIEFTETLNSGRWTVLTNVAIIREGQVWIDLDSPDHPLRFYRQVLR